MKAQITLMDVAAAAGVSKSTAANVFSRPDKVRPELRLRVEAAARKLDFDGPDPKGRLLSSGTVNAIGIVPPADAGIAWVYSDPYVRDLLAGVSDICEEKEVSLLMISARDRSGGSSIGRAVVDGLILGNGQQAELVAPGMRRKLRIVVLELTADADLSSLTYDDRGGARDLFRHLIRLGHRRFAFITVNRMPGAPVLHVPGRDAPGIASGYDEERECYLGAAEAMAEAGLSIEDMPTLEACGSDEERRDFGDPCDLLLDNAAGATALVSFNGSLAPKLLQAARRRGLMVPTDVSVAGFVDDPPDAIDPALTAVVRPISTREKGRMAARMLFDDGPSRHMVLPLHLAVGASTAPPPD